MRVEPNSALAEPEDRKAEPLGQLVRRHPLRQPEIAFVEEMLEVAGFELGPVVGVVRGSWPLTAVVYTSPNREGVGRSGSQVLRWPVRRRASV